jgi:RND family efflux transporter MFP subunit
VKGRNRTVLLAACALAFVVAAGIAIATRHVTPPTKPVAASAPNVPLARATFARYVSRVRAQGRVGAPSGGDAKLAFPGAGIVANVEVHVGQIVRTGEPLAELDTSGLAIDGAQARSDATAAAAAYGGGSVPMRALAGARARLALARMKLLAIENGTGTAQSDREAALAAVRQSEAKLAVDRSALDRQTVLYSGGVVAEKDVEAARETLAFDRADADANRAKVVSSRSTSGAALGQARADVAQAGSDVRAATAQVTIAQAQSVSARARFAAAEHLLAVATLRAPVDGVVTAILKHAGEAVDPTQPAIVIGPESASEVTLSVSVSDAPRVRPGDMVRMNVPGRGVSGDGRVRDVVPSVDPATQATTVVVDGIPAGAASGDAVEATIDVGERRGIVIPTSAIVEDPQSGFDIVFVRERMRDGTEKFVSREIAVASGDDERTLVASGLRGGERVASQGAFDLLAPGGGG